MYSVYVLGVGYHNVDMGHNMRWLNCEYGLELMDLTNQGVMVDEFEAYSMGWWQVRYAFVTLFAGTLFFMASMYDLLRIKNE